MYTVIIPCSGVGARFAGGAPKQYYQLGQHSILYYTLKPFIELEVIQQIIICVKDDDNYIWQYANLSPKITIYTNGSITRAKTVYNALNKLTAKDNDWILVHDAVRCGITKDLIMTLINSVNQHAVGGILAVKATDTIKQISDNVITTPPRDSLYIAQTPQMFRYGVLKQGLTNVNLDSITDEASAIEVLGLSYLFVPGDKQNFKLTYPSDLALANSLLKLSL